MTGGAGVIGLEMVPMLAEQGAEVLVGDLKPRPASFDSAVRYRRGDLNDMTLRELQGFGPELIIHLAATFERSTESYEFWEQNFRHNVRLSHHIMSLAKDLSSLKRVVFASSYLIYDPQLYQFAKPVEQPRALREDDPVLPRNLTGMAKLSHEIELRFLNEFRRQHFSSVCARIYRGYGRNSRDVISRWVRMLLNGEEIAVYRPEGRFDYIYAKDSAEGLIRLAEAPIEGIVNLGTGRSRRVQDVVDVLRQHFPQMRARVEASDIAFEASQADLTLYESATGWRPRYDLETAIPEIIAHETARQGRNEAAPRLGNILVSSASSKISLIRALAQAARRIDPEAKIVAGDMSDQALSRHTADHFWLMPRATVENLDPIIAGCRDRGITAILPTRDGELLFWAERRDVLKEAGITLISSPVNSIRRCVDKLAFAEFGASANLPFIQTATTPDELACSRFVVKERFGAGSRSIAIAVGRSEALLHGETLDSPIYQPFVEGKEISADAWLDGRHRVKGIVLRTRDRVVNGESQVTTTFREERIEELLTRVLEVLELSGPVVVQALIDAEGKVHVIECNARFGGASTLGIAAGVDSFYWSLAEIAGEDLSHIQFQPTSRPIRQVRLPADIYVDDPDL
ncbi:MAG TPA: NAD-dependent epimerase/dehydratase family protein [Sphingomonas sp.]|nr:NAD-dependent epimerase/dehydratase family protein [Sphingomonas sp.]